MDLSDIDILYRRYGPLVLRRARAILGDEEAAQDAAQEVFMRAMTKGHAFRGESSPVTWLYRITTNYCLNQIRDKSRRREINDHWLQTPSAAAQRPLGEVDDRGVLLLRGDGSS